MHTVIKCNAHCPPASFFLRISISLSALSFNITHDSALHDSAHLLCVCVRVCVCANAPASLRDTGPEASRRRALGRAYSQTCESSQQDSIKQSRLISSDTTLSVAEVANYLTQWLHHDLLQSPYKGRASRQLIKVPLQKTIDWSAEM